MQLSKFDFIKKLSSIVAVQDFTLIIGIENMHFYLKFDTASKAIETML